MRRRSSYQPTVIRSPKPKASRTPHRWVSWLAGCSFLVIGGSLWLDSGVSRAQQLVQRTNQDSVASQVKVLSVNSSIGNDTTGNGTEHQPFKTITTALRLAGRNTVILLAPGTYSTASGETFPLLLKAGVTIEGNPRTRGQNILIKGGGVFCRGANEHTTSSCTTPQNVTIVGATHAGLTGVTVTNPNQQGYGLWIESSSPVVVDNTFTSSSQDGILVSGNSVPLIRSNYLYENGVGGIAISGSARPEIRENVLSNTTLGITIAQDAAPRLMGNRISNNKDGVVVEDSAQPVLRNNIITNNERDGLVAIASSQPNLGTATEPGGNTFRSNGRFDISNKTSNELVAAFGNQLGDRTEGAINLTSRSSGIGSNPSLPNVESVKTGNSAPSSQPLTTDSSISNAPSPPPVSPVPTASIPNEVANHSTRQQETPLQILSLTRIDNSPSAAKPPASSSQPSGVPSDSNSGVATGNTISASSFPVPSGLSAETPVVSSNGQPTPPPVSSLSTAGITAEPRQQVPEVGRQITFEMPTPPTTGTPKSSSHGSPLPVTPGSSSDAQESRQTSNSLPTSGQNIPPETSLPRIERQAQGKKPTSSVSLSPSELHYRVIVEANSEKQKSLVRSLVPDAFHTVFKGRSVMQVGAYSDRAYAEEMLQILKSKGLTAIIEQVK